jgi:predicted ATPase/DNA-binding CsgD family transcriptional regulator
MSKTSTLIEPLTNREQEILAMLIKHCSNKEIASSLNLSVNSVKWYARQIYGKLGVENRRQVAARASELGLLSTFTTEEIPTLLSDETESQPKHNLPLQLTSFIGRENEIRQVKELLGSSRLVTLTGAGGVGKTRLALAVASQTLDEYEDGVWLVELAPLGDPQLIAGTMAGVFGVRADQDRPLRNALLDYLREKQLLLILDNCEHLIDGCAEMAGTILRACPQVRLLASSREALDIDGEILFYVPSLSFPGSETAPRLEDMLNCEAVQLFLERACLVHPGYALTEASASSLAQVCQRLDGIPLALELAAARLQVLSIDQIAARLDDRFRLLAGGSRRAMPRHQTLHALIDWSYDLLDEPERILFRRLSVFAGGWTLEACEVLCSVEDVVEPASADGKTTNTSSGEILDLLGGLVNKSLITVERIGNEVHGYRMLETIRQYAQEKLEQAGEAERMRDRHLDYFMGLAEQSEPLLRGPEVLQRLELLDDQLDNFRLALGWTFQGGDSERVAKGLRLGSAFGYYWSSRGLSDEGISYLQKGLKLLPSGSTRWERERAKALFVVASLILNVFDISRFDEARVMLGESLILYQKNRDQLGAAFAQIALGRSLMVKYSTSTSAEVDRVEYPLARSLAEQGLAICRKLGKPQDLAEALNANFYIDLVGMDYTAAKPFGEESLMLCESIGDKGLLERILLGLGGMALFQGDLTAATQQFKKAFSLAQELKDKSGMMMASNFIGGIAVSNQDYVRGEEILQMCLKLGKETGSITYQLASNRFLAYIMIHQLKLMRAREYLLKYLSMAEQTSGYEYDLRCFIACMAGVAQGTGKFVTAARFLGAVEAQFESFFKPLDRWDQAEFDWIVGQVYSQLDEATFTSAWAEGRGLTLDQAIDEARQITP